MQLKELDFKKGLANIRNDMLDIASGTDTSTPKELIKTHQRLLQRND
jgi:hypothetical protein